MKKLIRALVILLLLTAAFAFIPQAEVANAACLRVSRGTVLVRKVGSRYRMSGSNYYFNLSCSGRVITGRSTISEGSYCTGTRLINSRGVVCRITSIFVARSSTTVGLPIRSTTESLAWTNTWKS